MKLASFSFLLILLASLALSSCGNSEGTDNTSNKDTVSTYLEPKKDNTAIQPDSIKVQAPAESSSGMK